MKLGNNICFTTFDESKIMLEKIQKVLNSRKIYSLIENCSTVAVRYHGYNYILKARKFISAKETPEVLEKIKSAKFQVINKSNIYSVNENVSREYIIFLL